VQLYTGLALKGHGVVEEILEGLSRAVETRGLNRIGELVGAQANAWAQRERTTAGEDAYAT
jgi:dihydroorotate dehydrogenase